VKAFADHPLPRMLAAGLNVTVNTDDPSVSRITLTHEYQDVCEELKVSMDAMKQSILLAARSSFINDSEKKNLVDLLKTELKL
jgi:adenosine deaminase